MSAYTFTPEEAGTLKKLAERYANNDAEMDDDTKRIIDKVMQDASQLEADDRERLSLKSLIDITLAIEEASTDEMNFSQENLQSIAQKLAE